MIWIAAVLAILAAAWRFCDGRGIPPKTTVRNAVGLAIALGCAYVGAWDHFPGVGRMVALAGCAILAWASLVVGFTKWESWWSVVRYGGPACAIAGLAYLGTGNAEISALYALAGCFVGFLYVVLHRYLPFRYSTAVCEVAAGGIIVGGLAWITL